MKMEVRAHRKHNSNIATPESSELQTHKIRPQDPAQSKCPQFGACRFEKVSFPETDEGQASQPPRPMGALVAVAC